MTMGPVDNYLTAEEEAYFKSGGSDDAAERLESIANESVEATEDASPDDSRAEPESSNAADGANAESNDAAEAADDAEDESDYATESSDDDEKSPKRDYEKAFKVERHKRKELREALEANARKTAELEATLQRLQQNMQQQAQPKQEAPQEPIPDPDVDPLGYQQYQIKQLESQIQTQNKYLSERATHEQRAMQQQAFVETYRKSAMQFAEKTPEFKEAYQYLIENRIKEHVAAGYSPDEANALAVEEEMSIVAKAYQDKVNPAERLYNLAKHRGYSAKTSQTKTTAPKNLADIKKGMAKSKSLQPGGEALERELGIDDVDNMSPEEFDTFWAGYRNKAKQQGNFV